MSETLSKSATNGNKRKIITLLKKIALFGGLYDEEFIPLCEICTGQTFKEKEYFFKEGDHSRSMFVLLSGQVALSTEKKGTIYKLMPGEIFGEIGMITHNLRSASAQAISDSAILEISNTDYSMLLGKHPRISAIIMRHIAENLANHLVRTNE